MITLLVPTKPFDAGGDTIDAMAKTIWEKNIGVHSKQYLKIEDHCNKSYSLLEVQCTEAMKDNLREHPDYVWMEVGYGVFLVLRTMKAIIFKFEGHKNQSHAMHDVKVSLYMFRQGTDVSNLQLLEFFQSEVAVVGQFGGFIGINPGLLLEKYPGLAADLSNLVEDKTEISALLAR